MREKPLRGRDAPNMGRAWGRSRAGAAAGRRCGRELGAAVPPHGRGLPAQRRGAAHGASHGQNVLPGETR